MLVKFDTTLYFYLTHLLHGYMRWAGFEITYFGDNSLFLLQFRHSSNNSKNVQNILATAKK